MLKTHIFILSVLIVYITYYSFESDEYFEQSILTRTLETDGFCVLYNPVFAKDTVDFPCAELNDAVLDTLPPDYVFIDYIYKIHDVALSTFHRDVTSSKNIYKTQHTVYTLILYKYDGELLSVCPNSQSTYPFVWSNIVNIMGKSGTCFLFDCDLLHAGCNNKCRMRNVIQYKLCHKDDLPLLAQLRGVRAEKTEKCEITVYNLFLRKLSYFFEMPINYLFYPIMTKRESPDTIVGMIQSVIPLQYYNNT